MCIREEAMEGATLFTFGLGRRSGDIVSGIGVSLVLRCIGPAFMQPKSLMTILDTRALLESFVL